MPIGQQFRSVGFLAAVLLAVVSSSGCGPRPDSYLKSGRENHYHGDFEAAIADYTEAIRLDPNYAEAYNNRGLALQSQGDLDGAAADYTKAIRLKPDYADAYKNRGLVRAATGDYNGAIADCTEAIRLDPANCRALYNRPVALESLKRPADAEAGWRSYLDRCGDRPEEAAFVETVPLSLTSGASASP